MASRYPGMRHQRRPGRPSARPPVPREEMMEKLHAILYAEVGQAVSSVVHMEKNWSESEMVKRIVRYLHNAAKHEEVFSLPWDQGAKKFVSQAMHSFTASCQEKDWFYELDLCPVFQRA